MNFHRKLDEFGVEMRGNLYWKLDAFVLEMGGISSTKFGEIGDGVFLMRRYFVNLTLCIEWQYIRISSRYSAVCSASIQCSLVKRVLVCSFTFMREGFLRVE